MDMQLFISDNMKIIIDLIFVITNYLNLVFLALKLVK